MTLRGTSAVLVVALVLFVLLAGRNLMKSLELRRERACVIHVADIEGAKEQYALEHEGDAPPSIEALVPGYLPSLPACPAGGRYELGDMQVQASCSILSHNRGAAVPE